MDGNFIFEHFNADGPAPLCLDAADANDDGEFTFLDGAFILTYVDDGYTPPPVPGPSTCGQDETEDTLGCRSYSQDLCAISCAADADGVPFVPVEQSRATPAAA